MSITCAACTTNATTGVQTCTYTIKDWKLFYVNCPKPSSACSSTVAAYVPAITVCTQGL